MQARIDQVGIRGYEFHLARSGSSSWLEDSPTSSAVLHSTKPLALVVPPTHIPNEPIRGYQYLAEYVPKQSH